jgi:hypothetical protein
LTSVITQAENHPERTALSAREHTREMVGWGKMKENESGNSSGAPKD